jgi:hypothetical protein
MRKILFILFMARHVFPAADLSSTYAGDAHPPTFRNHNHELNWWLDKEKPGTFKLINTTTDEVSLQMLVKLDYCMPPKVVLPTEASRLNGYSFAIVEDIDKDGSYLVSSKISRLKFSKHHEGFHNVSVFQARHIILLPWGEQELALTDGYYLRGIQSQNESNFINFSMVGSAINLIVSKIADIPRLSPSYATEEISQIALPEQEYTLEIMATEYSEVVYQTAKLHYGLSKEEVDVANRVINKRVRLLETTTVPVNAQYIIPPITHRVWLTLDSRPMEVPADRLEYFRRSMQFYVGKPYRHMFWCTDPEKTPETVAYIKALSVPVEIHSIKEVSDDFICKELINRLLSDNLMAHASDIIRKEIVHIKGGMYFDVGLEQKKRIQENFFKKFDTVFYVRPWGEIDVCSILSVPKSAFLRSHLDFINSISTSHESFRKIYIPYIIRFCMLSSYSMMAQLMDSRHRALNFGFMLENEYFVNHGMGSWCNTNKHMMNINYLWPAKTNEFNFLPFFDLSLIYDPRYIGESTFANHLKLLSQTMSFSCSLNKNTRFEDKESRIIKVRLTVDFNKSEPDARNQFLYLHKGTSGFEWGGLRSPIIANFHNKNKFRKLLKVANYPEYSGIYPSEDSFYFTYSGQDTGSVQDLSGINGIFYCSALSTRYQSVLDALDEQKILKWYGPKSVSSQKSYRGFCADVVETIRQSKIALVLHSEHHIALQEPTLRIFEAAGAGAIIISDDHPFVVRNFGDSVLYVNSKDPESKIVFDILQHYEWIQTHHEEALRMGRKAKKIFTENFSLENEVIKFVQAHQETLLWEGKAALCPRSDFSYSYSNLEFRKINQLLKSTYFQRFSIQNLTAQPLDNLTQLSFLKIINSPGEIINALPGTFFIGNEERSKRLKCKINGKQRELPINLEMGHEETIDAGDVKVYDFFGQNIYLTGLVEKSCVSSYEASWNMENGLRVILR